MLKHAIAASFLVAAVHAQEAVYPTLTTPLNLDSGYLTNTGNQTAVVWSTVVTVPGGDWLQLHFRDTHLPLGSRLRLASTVRTDEPQWFDALSLRDYQFHSCQFSGPSVQVELHAGAGSVGNRVAMDFVRALQVSQTAEVDTICGTTDDRVQSSDPRACRINSSCSAWLFGAYAVGTAGHCMSSTSGQILHFNVPLSTSSGSTRPAAPNDQYALEPFIQNLNNGVGQDWCAVAAVRNSNTGLYPGQAQGSWYNVVNPPSFGSGQNIRITGYGTGNGVTGSPTMNQAQKTHVGPRASTTTSYALRYVTDTTGGNSGSPVIYENTGNVVGVHTHGGCSSTGGGNNGTSAARPDWTSARAAVLALHVVGELTTYGTGCAGSAGVPVLAFTGQPRTGYIVTVVVTSLPLGASAGYLAIGFGNLTWNGQPLPVDLTSYGMPGCTIYNSNEVTEFMTSNLGFATRSYSIPPLPALVGTTVHVQFFGADATANQVGLTASNGGRVFIGD